MYGHWNDADRMRLGRNAMHPAGCPIVRRGLHVSCHACALRAKEGETMRTASLRGVI